MKKLVKVYVVVVGLGVRRFASTRRAEAEREARRINKLEHPGGPYRARVDEEMWTPAELGR